jgi:ABC-2 type transport system permease protein/sodium transport system permease protein
MEQGLGNRLGRLGRLVRKELAEILRDRRTIITLVLMPILVYPLLAVAFQQYFSSLTLPQSPVYVLGFASETEANRLIRQLRIGDELLMMQEPQAKPSISNVRWTDDFFPNDLEQQVRDGNIHLGIRQRKAPLRRGKDEEVVFEVYYKSDSAAGRTLLDFVERRLAAANLRNLLRIPQRPPVRYAFLQRSPLEGPAGKGISLAALVPLILILMTITGAVYPAIDLTAGERERGTLEILVAAPVPRLGLLFAKYVSVLTVAVLTALVNLFTMLVTMLVSGLGAALFSQGELSVPVIMQLLGLLLLFAAFFSAVLLVITSFARSFKEAQAYLIPLMLLSLAPGVMGMLPGLTLEGPLSVVPLVNIVLLSRDLFEGGAQMPIALVVIASTLLYALAAIATAARIFGAEGVLYNEQTSWSDLLRRPQEERDVAGVASALLCLALIFPVWFIGRGLLAQLLAQMGGGSTLVLLGIMALSSVLLYAGFPHISAYWGHVRLRTGMQFHPASWGALAGGLVLGFSLWLVIVQLLAHFRPELNTLDQNTLEQSLKPFSDARRDFPLAIAGALVIQALAEEVFFRGYLFSALRAKSGPATTILVSALLFGFFHFIVMPAPLAMYRFLSSTILGLILGWVAWRSGSVFPSMILHGVHNAMLVLVGPGELELETLPWSWVVAGLVGTIVGVALLILWGAKRERQRAADTLLQ